MYNLDRMPNQDMLGTRLNDKYEWITWRECLTLAEDFSHGVKALKLSPEIGAEG